MEMDTGTSRADINNNYPQQQTQPQPNQGRPNPPTGNGPFDHFGQNGNYQKPQEMTQNQGQPQVQNNPQKNSMGIPAGYQFNPNDPGNGGPDDDIPF